MCNWSIAIAPYDDQRLKPALHNTVIQKATDVTLPKIAAPPGRTFEANLPSGIIYGIPPPAGVVGGKAPLTVTVTVDNSVSGHITTTVRYI